MSSAAGSATGPTSGLATSVADPDPSDQYVFGPPGSGSVFDFLSLKNDVHKCTSKSNKQKNFF
jgi:hypothetical protein